MKVISRENLNSREDYKKQNYQVYNIFQLKIYTRYRIKRYPEYGNGNAKSNYHLIDSKVVST